MNESDFRRHFQLIQLEFDRSGLSHTRWREWLLIRTESMSDSMLDHIGHGRDCDGSHGWTKSIAIKARSVLNNRIEEILLKESG